MFFNLFYTFLYVLRLIKIAPSISDDFTADKKLNKLLFSTEEALELFLNCKINDLLRSPSNFILIPITVYFRRP
jgi:hypothetical protein